MGFGFIPYQEATLKDVPMREARMNHEGIWFVPKDIWWTPTKTWRKSLYLKVYQVDQVAGSVWDSQIPLAYSRTCVWEACRCRFQFLLSRTSEAHVWFVLAITSNCFNTDTNNMTYDICICNILITSRVRDPTSLLIYPNPFTFFLCNNTPLDK